MSEGEWHGARRREPPPRPMLLCAPSPPTSEGPGEAPGPGCKLTWILWDPRSLRGRLGGALCLPQGVSGALLRLCRGSSPAGGDGRGGALRAGAQARGAAVWLRPQVGAPPAGSRLKGKPSSPARCFPLLFGEELPQRRTWSPTLRPPPAPGTWFSARRLPSQRRPPPPPGPPHPAPCPWHRSRGLSSAAWGVPGGNASEASAQTQESRVKRLNCWFSCSWNLPPAQGRPHAAGGPQEAVPSRRRPRPPSRGTKKRRKERPPALSHAAPPGRQVVGSPPPPSRRQPCSRESGRQLARGLSLGGLGSAGRPQLHSTRVLGATPLEPPPSLCRDLPRLCGSLPPPGPYTPYSLPTCPAPP